MAAEEGLQPDLSVPVDVVYDLITDWFPGGEAAEQLAFAIVHDGLHLKHLVDNEWTATIDRPLQPRPQRE